MFRVSLRELLLLTAFFGAGLAALKYAGELTLTIVSNVVPFGLMIATVIALVVRGRRQAMASGCASCLAIYFALLMFTGEAPHLRGRWATDILLVRLHKSIVTRTWVDRRTKQEVAYNPKWMVDGQPSTIRGMQSPDEHYFKAVGHYLWALVFGYLGSRFATWIYDRRHNYRSTPPNSDRPGPGLVPANR